MGKTTNLPGTGFCVNRRKNWGGFWKTWEKQNLKLVNWNLDFSSSPLWMQGIHSKDWRDWSGLPQWTLKPDLSRQNPLLRTGLPYWGESTQVESLNRVETIERAWVKLGERELNQENLTNHTTIFLNITQKQQKTVKFKLSWVLCHSKWPRK